MGLRFRKSFKIAPGVRVNVGKKSAGLSFGGKGLRYSINTNGRRTTSVGIPGTGLYHVSTSSSGKSYKTKQYQTRSQLNAQERQLQKLQEMERAKYEVTVFENQCELVKTIHKEADEPVNWHNILTSSPPFEKGTQGPNEHEARKKYNEYRPNFFERLFKMDEKKYKHLNEEIQQAIIEDQNQYNRWEELVGFAREVLAGNIDTYLKVIEEMDPLGDLSEFGSGFEFSTDDPAYMEVEFEVHSESVIPSEQKSLTKTGKLSVRQLPKTKYYDLQQDYVCSCVIRIARDLFALLPLQYVIIHAFDEQLNTETGHNEQLLILSIKIERETLESLNIDNIDCSDAMNNFSHNMNFRKTKGFAAVQKI